MIFIVNHDFISGIPINHINEVEKMSKKIRISLTLIAVLYLIGSYMIYIGLAKGMDVASNLSRPRGATSWTISNELVNGCTYTPNIMGLSLIRSR